MIFLSINTFLYALSWHINFWDSCRDVTSVKNVNCHSSQVVDWRQTDGFSASSRTEAKEIPPFSDTLRPPAARLVRVRAAYHPTKTIWTWRRPVPPHNIYIYTHSPFPDLRTPLLNPPNHCNVYLLIIKIIIIMITREYIIYL